MARNAKSKKKRAPKTVLKLPDLEQSKSAVLNSLTSPSSQRSYDHAIREFIDWYCSEPRLAFTRATDTSAPRRGRMLQALALLFLKLNQYAFNIDLVFYGIWCVLTGYLIFKSTFLPRILGVLLAIGGLGYMTYLYPPLAYCLFVPYIAAAAALGEIPLELWLIVRGVNGQRWKEQASAAFE